MGILLNILYFIGFIVAAMAAGWLFKTVMTLVSPRGIAKEMRTAPLTASFGMLMILIYIVVAVFAPLIAPYPETQIVGREFQPWDGEHWLGTDTLGRDML